MGEWFDFFAKDISVRSLIHLYYSIEIVMVGGYPFYGKVKGRVFWALPFSFVQI